MAFDLGLDSLHLDSLGLDSLGLDSLDLGCLDLDLDILDLIDSFVELHYSLDTAVMLQIACFGYNKLDYNYSTHNPTWVEQNHSKASDIHNIDNHTFETHSTNTSNFR